MHHNAMLFSEEAQNPHLMANELSSIEKLRCMHYADAMLEIPFFMRNSPLPAILQWKEIFERFKSK